jgi:hypothetical protein
VGKAYRNNKVGRTRAVLAKKKLEVQRPLPHGRIKHLKLHIARLEASLKDNA